MNMDILFGSIDQMINAYFIGIIPATLFVYLIRKKVEVHSLLEIIIAGLMWPILFPFAGMMFLCKALDRKIP